MATNAEEFHKLNRRVIKLERRNKQIKSALIIFIILFLLSLVYIIYSEVATPLFGKWPDIAEEKEELELYNEYLVSRMDSVSHANDLLMENSPHYTGVFFEVQIGAFEKFDLSGYSNELVKMGIDNGSPYHKYVLGKFRSYDKANAFKKDIRKMGIQDAFIVGKIDGERVDIKQAISASLDQNY